MHVADLADLYVAALERAPAGTLLHGVAEESVPVRALAAARAAGVDGAVRALPLGEARRRFGGPFADAPALDQAVSGTRARHLPGWHPYRDSAEKSVSSSYAVGSRTRTA